MHVHSAPRKPAPSAAFLGKGIDSPFSQSYTVCLETMETSLTIPSRDYQALVCLVIRPLFLSYITPRSIPKTGT